MLLDPYIKDVVCAETKLVILAVDSSNVGSKKKGMTVFDTMVTADPPKSLKY